MLATWLQVHKHMWHEYNCNLCVAFNTEQAAHGSVEWITYIFQGVSGSWAEPAWGSMTVLPKMGDNRAICISGTIAILWLGVTLRNPYHQAGFVLVCSWNFSKSKHLTNCFAHMVAQLFSFPGHRTRLPSVDCSPGCTWDSVNRWPVIQSFKPVSLPTFSPSLGFVLHNELVKIANG